MIPKNYNHISAARLSSVCVLKISSPEEIDVLWMRPYSFEKSNRYINFKEHKHSFFEVHFIFCGSVTYEVGGACHTVGEGEAILIPEQLPHRVKSASDDLVKINIAFSSPRSPFSFISRSKAFHFFINELLMSDFERILYEAEHQYAYYLSVIKDRAFSVLSMILRQARIVEKPVRRICENTACGIAARYIEDNKNLFLTCRDVAAYCHFNEKYLSRLFKKELGMTLLEYIHAVKTNEAKRLLSETEAPLSEVAEMLGFSNEYYFNSFFKRNIGISPGSYRAKGK